MTAHVSLHAAVNQAISFILLESYQYAWWGDQYPASNMNSSACEEAHQNLSQNWKKRSFIAFTKTPLDENA